MRIKWSPTNAGPRQSKQLPFAGETAVSNPALQTVQPTRKATGKVDSFGHRVHRTFAPIPTNGRVVCLSGEGDIEAVHWQKVIANHSTAPRNMLTAKDGNVKQEEAPKNAHDNINLINICSSSTTISILEIGTLLSHFSC